MGEGQSPSTPAHPLVFGQSLGRQTGDGKPRQTDAWSGWPSLGEPREESRSNRPIAPVWLPTATFAAAMDSETSWARVPALRHADGLCILHLLTKQFGNDHSEGCTPGPDRSRPDYRSDRDSSHLAELQLTPIRVVLSTSFLKRNGLISEVLSHPAQPRAE
jgi:hypothetical protein